MNTFSSGTLEAIKASAAESIQALEEGKDVREVAKDIYCTLPDKSEEIGYRMADHFATLVEEYHSHVDRCMENEDKYLDEQLVAAVEGKSPAEACVAYHRMLVALTAGAIINKADPADDTAVAAAQEEARSYVEAQKELQLNNDTDAEKLAQEMAEAVKQSLKDSKLVSAQLPELLLNLQDETLETATIVPAFGRKSKDLKLILSVQAYVNVKNGSADIDPNVSMRDVTFMTCGSVDTCAVAAELEEGSITEETAKEIMDVIGLVLGMLLLAAVAYILVGIVMDLLVAIFSVSTLAGVILVGIASSIAVNEILSDKIVQVIYTIGIVTARTVGYALGKMAGLLVRGLKKLTSIMKAGTEAAVERIKEHVSAIRSLATERAPASEREETRTSETAKPVLENEEAEHQPVNVREHAMA